MAVKIIPAILAFSPDEFLATLRRVPEGVERVQIDIVGRAFSADVTVPVEVLENVSRGVVFDAHLMVREPVAILSRCDAVGVSRVFGHIEQMRDQNEFIEQAFSLEMQVGLGLDLFTPVSAVEQALSLIDAILVMSVPAGKSGQIFQPAVLEKITAVRALHSTLPICVDGGITPRTIKLCVAAGATEFAVSSFLWKSRDVGKALAELVEAVR